MKKGNKLIKSHLTLAKRSTQVILCNGAKTNVMNEEELEGARLKFNVASAILSIQHVCNEYHSTDYQYIYDETQ